MALAPELLEAALSNTSLPHQPYVVISDEPTFGAVPLIREMIRRSLARGSSVLLVSVMRPPQVYLPSSGPSERSPAVIDLTESIPGYGVEDDLDGIKKEILASGNSLSDGVVEKLGTDVEIYIDSIDTFAEDHTPSAALSLVRALLKLIKSNKLPSRLILSSSPHSPFFPSLLPPTLSSSLTHLQLHPLDLLTSLSNSYLTPISPTPKFWDLLSTAVERRSGERMAWLGEGSIGDWSGAGIHGKGNGKGKGKTGTDAGEIPGGGGVAAVQVTVRKATGGAKGMSRSLEGLAIPASPQSSAGGSSGSLSMDSKSVRLVVRPLDTLIDLQPFSRTVAIAKSGQSGQPAGTGSSGGDDTHFALHLPFNLSLTDEQRRRRDQVPIPYVHEGEGVEIGWEEEEEDEDDEEI